MKELGYLNQLEITNKKANSSTADSGGGGGGGGAPKRPATVELGRRMPPTRCVCVCMSVYMYNVCVNFCMSVCIYVHVRMCALFAILTPGT